MMVARLPGLGSRVAVGRTRIAAAGKRADGLYVSRQWRALARQIKAKRGNWCERCGSTHRVAGDHIVEVKDGGATLDETNVELMCQSCHNAKTAATRARRAGLAP